MTGRRRATSGTPRALDGVRSRRGSQQAASGAVAGRGNTVDASGRVQADLGPEFFFDERGRFRLRVDGVTLVLLPGSPVRLAALLGDDSIQIMKGHGLVARPKSSQVIPDGGYTDKDLTKLLNRFEQAFQAGDANNAASIASIIASIAQPNGIASLDGDGLAPAAQLPFQFGTDSTAGLTVTVASTFAVAGACSIVLTPFREGRSFGSEQGTIVDGVSFTVTSTIDGDFWWQVWKTA